jgi:hypothetical protein
MADSSGYQVVTGELNSFANYLETTTVSEINTAAQGVTGANKADVNAFGVALAQAMAVPCRIAMGVVASNLRGLSQKISGVSDTTRTTANTYDQNEADVATTFSDVQGA